MHASSAVHESSHSQPHRAHGPRRTAHALIATSAAAVTVAALAAPSAVAVPAGSTALIDRPAGDAALPFDGFRYSILQSRQSMSADGNLVVFESDSDALHAGEGDKTERYVYLRDRAAGTTTNVCRTTAGALGDRGCNEVAISPNGRYVAFRTASTNFGSGSPSLGLIYRRDLQTGTTELMSRETGAAGSAPGSGYITGGIGVADTGTVVFATTASLSPIDAGNSHTDVYARIGTETRLLSRTSAAVIGNASSEAPTISGDGSVVAFESDATNFSGTDANSKRDVYTTPISASFTPTLGSRRTAANEAGNAESRWPSLSHNGRYLGFSTSATNLFGMPITTDANGLDDVILRDTIGNTNTVVSIGAGNVQANGYGAYGATVSPDGTKVGFSGTIPAFGGPTDRGAAFVRDIAAAKTTLVSRANGADGAAIGGGSTGGVTNDGVVAFGGELVAAGTDEAQIFVRLAAQQESQLVSVPSGAAPTGPFASDAWVRRGAASADGGLVAFSAKSSALTGKGFDGNRHALLRDVRTGAVRLLDVTAGGNAASGDADGVTMSADGSTVAFVSDADDLHPDAGGSDPHLFVLDLASGAFTVADRNQAGQVTAGLGEPDVTLSDDGKVVAFTTEAKLDPAVDTNTSEDVYVRDLRTGTVQLASRRNGADGAATANGAWSAALSGDGTRVGFTSSDPNLVAGDANAKSDAFVRDLAAGTTLLVSRIDGADGAPGNGVSNISDLSADGTRVAFTSQSTNLGNGDTSTETDVHVRDLTTGQTLWASRPEGGVQSNNGAGNADLSADGTRIAFSTRAANFVTPDANGSQSDAFLRDLGSGTLARISVTAAGGQSTTDVQIAALSANGRCAVLDTHDTGLVDGGYASPDYSHVYLRAIDADCPGPLPTKGPETGPEQKPAADKTAPTVSKLALTRKAFATKGKKKGSTLTFTLSEAAKVKLTVSTTAKGRKKGKSCVKPSKAKRGAKKCTIVGKPKDLVNLAGVAGKNTVKVTGWAKGKKLPKGTYRLSVLATDAAGNKAKTAVIDFRIT